MPTTYEVDPRTGKIKKVSGRGGLESAPVARATPSKPQAAKPTSRPWWWYATPAGINNEVLYRLKQQAEFNKGQKLIAGSAANPVMAGDPVYYDTRKKPTDIAAYSPALRSTLQATAAVLGKAPADERLMMVNLALRFFSGDPFKARDPESTPLGQVIKGYERGVISALGAKQVEQMTPDQKGWFYDMPAAMATNAALAPLTPSLPVAFGGAGLAGQALRWPLNLAIDSAVGGMFIDQTQGTSSDMLAEAGVPGFGALRIQPGKDDRVSSALKGIPGDIAIGAALGGTLSAGLRLIEAAPSVARNLRERRVKSEVETARAQTVANGVQEVADPDTGEHRFPQSDQQPPKTWKQAATEMLGPKPEAAPIPSVENPTTETFGKAQPADLPTVQDPQEDAWYDPSVPEIDIPAVALNRLDDQALMQLDEAEGPVLPQIEQRMAVQQVPEPDPMVSTATTAAPTQNLAEPITPYADQWQGLSNDELLRVAHPASSPDLFAKVQGLTGREFEQFTRQDVLDGLGQLQQEGKTVIPNRLLSNTELMKVGDITVRPKLYQFKDNVDAKGIQKGGSLTGVTQWNPDAENVAQVWDNPMTGTTDMINGHHRLEKAKELGIPTLRVEKLLASTPEQARSQGALSNISSGGGTAFDAAKYLREQGVKDEAGMKRLGVPLDSGLGGQGLALSRLPDNIFQDAVDGRLSTNKAVALGASGLDEVQMQAAIKALGSREISDTAFKEVLQQARSAPVIKAGEKAQKSLFDDDEAISLAVVKGNLADKVRADLIGDKNLMGRVGKNADKLQEAGNKISVQGSTQVAMDTQALLGNFMATKYAEGTPISQLLNEGAQQIADGAKPGVVATRIKRQLVEAAKATPAVEVPAQAMPAATAAEDAAATELVNKAFANLSPADRDAVKARILQKAIANREVRPSATPITPTPEGPKAGLDDAAGLAADEQRLAGEYAARDALVAQELARAERQSTGYNNKSFEEKKATGITEGWKPRSVEETMDTRGQGRYFHGTAQEIPGDKPASVNSGNYWTDTNIFGNGFYTTDDFHTAGNKYTKKGKAAALKPEKPIDMYGAQDELASFGGATSKEVWSLTRRTTDIPPTERLREIAASLDESIKRNRNPTSRERIVGLRDRLLELADNPPKPKEFSPVAYEVVEKQPVNFFDADRQIPWSEDSPEAALLRQYDFELWNEILGDWEAEGQMSYGEMLDTARSMGPRLGLPIGELADTLDFINGHLAELGYGGLKHEGGIRAGGGARTHDVKIYWDAENQIDLKRVGVDGPEPVKVQFAKPETKVADIFENLANALVDSDRRTFRQVDRLHGLTKRAIKELEAGDPTTALKEASVFGERRVAELQSQIDTIKQNAIQEGC
jgi:hypothetical protein